VLRTGQTASQRLTYPPQGAPNAPHAPSPSHGQPYMSRRPTAFSVIIPTHNRCALVMRAIDSVLANTVTGDLEVIVADDGSTDATMKVVQEAHQHDTRVRALGSKVNEGPSGARNRGLAAATGDLVLFLDSDDVLLPHALAFADAAFQQLPELQFLTLEGEASSLEEHTFEQDIVRSRNPGWRAEGFTADLLQKHSLDPPTGVDGPPRVLEFGDLFPAILFGDLFFLSGVVIRRHIAVASGPFNLRYRFLEDWDFTARLCLSGVGGYLDYIGFHRETGRADQLGRVGTPWRRALMHQHILATVRATGRVDSIESRALLRRAQAAADYWLGRCLLEQRHDHLARTYLTRSLRQAYKPVKSLVWLVAGQRLARTPRYLSTP
jgi:glycosyltransferase involved in cell wall biosynthesis